jgi:MFS family permease
MLFHLGGCLGQNISTLIVTRLFAGLFGSCRACASIFCVHRQRFNLDSAALSNAGGVLSDMWIARERGFATSLYFLAPCLGPRKNVILLSFRRFSIDESILSYRSYNRGLYLYSTKTGVALHILGHVHVFGASCYVQFFVGPRNCECFSFHPELCR